MGGKDHQDSESTGRVDSPHRLKQKLSLSTIDDEETGNSLAQVVENNQREPLINKAGRKSLMKALQELQRYSPTTKVQMVTDNRNITYHHDGLLWTAGKDNLADPASRGRPPCATSPTSSSPLPTNKSSTAKIRAELPKNWIQQWTNYSTPSPESRKSPRKFAFKLCADSHTKMNLNSSTTNLII